MNSGDNIDFTSSFVAIELVGSIAALSFAVANPAFGEATGAVEALEPVRATF